MRRSELSPRPCCDMGGVSWPRGLMEPRDLSASLFLFGTAARYSAILRGYYGHDGHSPAASMARSWMLAYWRGPPC
ncbi:hypothetical protein SAMN05443248_3017 [Bradyrhizobium erythrophlei]|uniref:Uncharacterized protein n=1 Tax=Bradyrhizobium erythrophlei TaxID=1437360 RepID=A0A1M5NJ91_9BRAD|nr:hypothetical protein SAMN05443248_3017 [Bradyrhizobium erythrophlei]